MFGRLRLLNLLAAGSAAVFVTGLSVNLARADEIVVYDALDFAGKVAKAFTAKTGIEVKLVEPGSTGEVLGKIAAEGDNPQFDVVWLDGSAIMDRMAQDGILKKVPELAAKVDYTAVGKKLVPASGAYIPTSVSTTMIAVNSKKVPADKMPKSWADLANPEFSGAVAAKDPNLSGPAYQWLAGLFQTDGVDHGKEFLKKALTNKKLAGLSSGGKVNAALLTGDAKVAVAQDSATFAKISAGEPLVAIYPSEGVIALPAGLGVSAKTKNMPAVAKFVEFVTSKEGQAAMLDGKDGDFFLMPIVNGVEAKAGRKTDISFIFLDNAAASAHETEWKQWYRENFVP
jgi:iron(III) transport system substrate-binding protein